MGVVKLVRGIGKILRGGADRRQVFLGCLLGVLVGMIPGFNGTLVLAVGLFFLVNANGLLAAGSLALGKVLCLVLAPVTFNIGYVVIHQVGLERFFRWAADTPVLALMDLHVYSLIGGLPIALVLGSACGVFANRVLSPLQVRLAGAPANRALAFVLNLAFGKQRGLEEKRSLFRFYRLVVGVIAVGLLIAGATLLSSLFAADVVETSLTQVVGAEVNVVGARLSTVDGSIQLEGLQVTNPGKPSHNWVQAERLAADVDMSALLARSLVIDRIEGSGLRADSPREREGRVLVQPVEEEKAPADLSGDSVLRYLKAPEEWRKHLEYVKRALEYLQRPEPEERKDYLGELAGLKGYLRLSAEDVLPLRPSVLIRSLSVGDIQLAGRHGVYRVEGQYLSSSPARNPAPMTLTVSDGEGLLLSLELAFALSGESRLRVEVPRIPLGAAFQLSESAPVALERGQARALLEGTLRPEFRCELVVDLRDVELRVREGRGVLGLEPETANRIFDAVSNFTFRAELSGAIDRPNIHIDSAGTLASLKDALIEAGRGELARRADELLEEVAPGLGEEGMPPAVLEGVRKVWPGLGREKEGQEDAR